MLGDSGGLLLANEAVVREGVDTSVTEQSETSPVSTIVPSESDEGSGGSSSADEMGDIVNGVAVGVGVLLMDNPCDESSKRGTNENVRFRGGRLDLRNEEGADVYVDCVDTGGGGTGILWGASTVVGGGTLTSRARRGVVGGDMALGDVHEGEGMCPFDEMVVGLRGKSGIGTLVRKTFANGLDERASAGCSARGSSRSSILSLRMSS